MKHFGKGGTNRKGFWISKFMRGKDGRYAPMNEMAKTDDYETAFFNVERMTRDNNQYGLEYTEQMTSIPRNTEYGAVYYLTGIGNPEFVPNGTSTANMVNTSSAIFGNVTGIYDLNNGVREWTADIAISNFKDFEDKIKALNMANYGTETQYMKKDQNGRYIDRVPLVGKVKLVLDRIITSSSDKSHGEAALEFMVDYNSRDAAPYGGKSIAVGKNNPYNTRTSDMGQPNKSVYSFEGVDRNPGNIGYRAVIYAYEPVGVQIITPRTPDAERERLLRDNPGKYVKITFKSEANIYQLESLGYDGPFGVKTADFYIPKGSKFPMELYAAYKPGEVGGERYGSLYRFLGWSIHPKSQEFYKDTVIQDRSVRATTRTIRHTSSSGGGGDPKERREKDTWEETVLDKEPYLDRKYKATVKVIDENLGYMHTFGTVPVNQTAGEITRATVSAPGFSPVEYEIEPGLSAAMYFLPYTENLKVFTDDLVLTTILLPNEIDKYKSVRYFMSTPQKTYIGEETVLQGNKPRGLERFQAPAGKRLSGWAPSIDTVVTDDMEIEAILEDIPERPITTPVNLTVNLDGGTSNLMQNGEKIKVEKGSKLSDPNNATELNRIRTTTPTKLGYRFKGWSISESVPIYNDTEIKALWERETVKATYMATEADGTYVRTKVFNAGNAPGNPDEEPKREGYKFNGWQPSTSIPTYSDTVYKAEWVKKDDSRKTTRST